MKHPPITHSLELATMQPPDTWVEFYTVCKEMAATARQRRAQNQARASEEADGDAPEQPAEAA